MEDSRITTVYLDGETRRRLEEMARRTECSQSAVVRLLIRQAHLDGADISLAEPSPPGERQSAHQKN